MIGFLERVLNAQLVVVLLAGAAACALRAESLIAGSECVDVLKTCLWAFVGGTLIREGAVAFAKKGELK